MKILIAYDGTPPADASIDDLTMAGLPETGEAVVLSVAEVWLPPENLQDEETTNPYIEGIVEGHRQRAREAVVAARGFAERAREQVLTHFPGWNVTAEGTYGSPAWELIDRSQSLDADLIVVAQPPQSLQDGALSSLVRANDRNRMIQKMKGRLFETAKIE